jgi:hypothetical protein
MPKAPRDKDSAAPKKTTKSRKVTPTNGNGVHAESGNGNGNGAVAVPVTVSKKDVISTPAASLSEVIAAPAASLSVEERIRARAYELYLQRGDNHGSPEQDWLRAVEEVRGQAQRA